MLIDDLKRVLADVAGYAAQGRQVPDTLKAEAKALLVKPEPAFPYDLTQMPARPNDVLLLRCKDDSERQAATAFATSLAAAWTAQRPDIPTPLVLVIPKGVPVNKLPEGEMNAQGWYRQT